jgi:hypothetical protein
MKREKIKTLLQDKNIIFKEDRNIIVVKDNINIEIFPQYVNVNGATKLVNEQAIIVVDYTDKSLDIMKDEQLLHDLEEVVYSN